MELSKTVGLVTQDGMLAPSAGIRFSGHLLLTLLFIAALVSRITLASGPHTLTVSVSGSGAVSRNPNFPQYPNGSVVTLTATHDSGFLFSHWTGDLTGSSNPANIEMTSSRTVVAHFVPIPNYTVTTSVSGEGAIGLNPPGGTYPSNTVVTATATAAQGWAFASWTGDAEGNANPLQLTIDRNKSITAHFAELVKISDHPDDVSTNSGSSVIFEVAASGTPPLHFQWSLDGEPITGATEATLMISNVQPTNEGTYSVIVSNAYSSATAAATLRLTDFECTGPNVVTEPTEAALRNAIAIGGHVQLCFNGTITLTQAITITKDVALDATARQVTISGNNATRILNVETNITLALTNLTLTGGLHRGSDGFNGGLPGYGGAIWNHGGTLLISHCALTNNAALGGNGTGTTTLAPGGPGLGGAIFSEYGALTIVSSSISSNAAAGGQGNVFFPDRALGGNSFGGGIAAVGGSVAILDSSLEHNLSSAPISGSETIASRAGALYLTNTAALISNSVLRANAAIGSAIRTEGLFMSPTAAFGGAVLNQSGHLEIVRSALIANLVTGGFAWTTPASAAGGAIFSEGPVSIRYSTISSNKSLGGSAREGGLTGHGATGHGGAWYNASTSSASECLFTENIVEGGAGASSTEVVPAGHALGGAIDNRNSLSITNCTFSLNVARPGQSMRSPFPIGNSAGGAVYNTGSVLAVNTTFGSNETSFSGAGATSGGSFFGANIANTNGTVTLRNSILAYPNGTNSNVHGPITDAGHNISSDGSANFNSGTSFNFTNPRLEPLADNGGPTLTMALQAGSPAIDFAATEGAPAIDQRGVVRPFGSGIDIGAYEWRTWTTEHQLQLTFQAAAETSYEIQSSTNLSDWVTLETIPPSQSSTIVTRQYEPSATRTFYQLAATHEKRPFLGVGLTRAVPSRSW
jgi:hypothetical protein